MHDKFAPLTEENGDDGEERAAQGVHHPERAALHQRGVKGKESVTSPHQEGEEDPGSQCCQAQLQPLTAQRRTLICRKWKTGSDFL